MSQDTPHVHISKRRVVYTMPAMDAVTVRRDEAYRDVNGRALKMDLYYPPAATSGARTPAVIFVTGFPDAGAERMLGCQQKEMGSYISWAQLVAASGLVAITYANDEPVTDAHAVLEYLQHHAESLDIDDRRVAVWACSGNVPNALSVLMQGAQGCLRCAVLCYGYMLDLDGSTCVADAARQFGFANPGAGKSVADLPGDLPLFIARCGRDAMPDLNESLDRFVLAALTRNLPVTVVNHAAAPHAFDLFDDTETSRVIIRQVLEFMRGRLMA